MIKSRFRIDWKYILFALMMSLPTFIRMIRPGIFSMQDFHIFRQIQFDKCVLDLQIPCRWAMDAGLGYGEPLFNFYGQLVYAFGEIFVLLGTGYINAIKVLFILSLALSGVGMYLLSSKLWNNKVSGILSAVLYVYAPYRAVDVYVRGALPEAFAFVFFPLIALALLRLTKEQTKKNVLLLSLLLSGITLTHNLSVVMFIVFLIPWVLIFLRRDTYKKIMVSLIKAGALSLLLSAFYVLPLIFESSLVRLDTTTVGYFDFRAHFATIRQLLFDRSWGYGASLWGPVDDLNISVGLLQWVLSLCILPFAIKRKNLYATALILIGWFALFLTHNKSTFIWEALPFMSYIQFPWRFLSIAVFAFSLGSGFILTMKQDVKKAWLITIAIYIFSLVSLFQFFKEDLWFTISDNEIISGERWNVERSSSLGDYWPAGSNAFPTSVAPSSPYFSYGEGEIESYRATSNSVAAKILIESDKAEVIFPIVYFPGWKGENIKTTTDLNLISVELLEGDHTVTLSFENTLVRTLGNLISLLAIIGIIIWKRR